MSETYEVRQTKAGYAEESTFGTAIADDQAFAEVTCDSFNVDPDVMIHELPMNHGTRQPVEQSSAHSVQGSSAKFSINGPVDLNDIDQILYSHFQKVVEAGDTEFTKTFTYFSTHPDFSSDEGHFLTWIKRLPEASTSQKMKSCIAPRVRLFAERNGMLMFESDWVSLGSSDDDANPSGVWTPRDGTGLVYFNDIVSATLTRGSGLTSPVALVMQSFEVEGNYEVENTGHDATNGFEQYGLYNRTGTFKIKMLRDSTADEALISLKSGELVQFDVDLGTITTAVTGKIESLEYDDEGLLVNEITCSMKSSYSAGSVGECLSIVVQNSVDRSWPAA